MEKNRLVIRADAGGRFGTGHVMRCLALAQEWVRGGGEALFVCACLPEKLRERLEGDGIDVALLALCEGQVGGEEDVEATLGACEGKKISALVVDGYQFGGAFQLGLKKKEMAVLFFDDYGHADFYHADWVLNQNVYASAGLYAGRISEGTELLLGTRFTLLRREFLDYKTINMDGDREDKRLLVTMGGSDPEGVTRGVLRELRGVLENVHVECRVVIGPDNGFLAEIEKEVADFSNVKLVAHPKNMAEQYDWADFVITAGGSAVWELAFLGKAMGVVCLAENQRKVCEALEERGAAVYLEERQSDFAQLVNGYLCSGAKRERLQKSAQAMVDGKGAERICALLACAEFSIMRVTMDDARLLWQWANDPETRANSFCSDPIPWEEHLKWLEGKVKNRDCYFYLIKNKRRENIAQVRFDLIGDAEKKHAVISISLAKESRGKGLGAKVIAFSSAYLLAELSNIKIPIHAHIRPENQASRRAFTKAGYVRQGEGESGEVFVKKVD